MKGALFFVWDVSWPFVTPVPAGSAFAPIIMPGAQQIVSYHIVTEGSVWGALAGETPVRLDAGDILLIPHGDAYTMASAPDACAGAAGSSRSRLAESFARLGGQPPMQYLACWRMQLGARLLAESGAKVVAVARGLGYDSEAAFSRAFKRFVGVSPARWRKQEPRARAAPASHPRP